MNDTYVNADWSAVVPAGSQDAAYGIQAKDVKRLGIDKLPTLDGAERPEPIEAQEPKTLVSANLLPEPETVEAEAVAEPDIKQAPQPADKQATTPADKSRRRRGRK